MRLELWRVTEHEGLAAVRRVATSGEYGSLSYPLEQLHPGTYILCDPSGNRLKLTVEDAREAGEIRLAVPPWDDEDDNEAGRSHEPGGGRKAG